MNMGKECGFMPANHFFSSAMPISSGTTALCIGHPGHEMQVFEWMHRCQPLMVVFTDGSGPDRPSRFQLTVNLMAGAGARQGVFQGNYSDRHFYDLILQKAPEPFLKMAERLAEEWIEQQVETVAGDMMEGFSPTHDLCRVMINAAIQRVEKKTGRRLVNLQFPLERLVLNNVPEDAVIVTLSDEQFSRKRQAALSAYPALASEVEKAILKYGEAAFKVETLVPVQGFEGLSWDGAQPPFYETYGRKQIALGHYSDLITHAEHIRPLAESLYAWAVN